MKGYKSCIHKLDFDIYNIEFTHYFYRGGFGKLPYAPDRNDDDQIEINHIYKYTENGEVEISFDELDPFSTYIIQEICLDYGREYSE